MVLANFKPFIAVQSLDMFIYLGRDIQIFSSSRRLACNVSKTVNLQPSFTSIPSKLYRMYKVSFINWSFREYSPRSYKIWRICNAWQFELVFILTFIHTYRNLKYLIQDPRSTVYVLLHNWSRHNLTHTHAIPPVQWKIVRLLDLLMVMRNEIGLQVWWPRLWDQLGMPNRKNNLQPMM